MIADFFNIKTSGLKNKGGLCRFWFIPLSEVDVIPYVQSQKILTNITLVATKVWRKGYATKDSLEFLSKPQKGNTGLNFENKLNGIVPLLQPTMTDNFMAMAGSVDRFIAIAKDQNGIYRLLGNSMNGLQFIFGEANPGNAGGFNGYSFSFFNNSPDPVPYYLYGVATTETSGGPPVA
jgi:hypothetical protein